jgi:hypothetical protein
MLVAVALLLTSHSVARADECFTQGYDFSSGSPEYYAYTHECLGSAAPWYFYYGNVYRPYVPYMYQYQWYNYTPTTWLPVYRPFSYRSPQVCYGLNGGTYYC